MVARSGFEPASSVIVSTVSDCEVYLQIILITTISVLFSNFFKLLVVGLAGIQTRILLMISLLV